MPLPAAMATHLVGNAHMLAVFVSTLLAVRVGAAKNGRRPAAPRQ